MPIRPAPNGLGGIGWGFRHIWITTSDGLSEVDPTTGGVARSASLTGCPGCPGAPLAIGLGRIFVTGGGNGSNDVQVIDPRTPGAVQKVFPTQPYTQAQGAFFIATGFGSVWVWPSGGFGRCDGRMFWRLDPSTGKRIGRWAAPNVQGWDRTDEAHGVAIGAGAAWILRDDELRRLAPGTNTIAGELKTTAAMVTTAGGEVWTITNGHVVSEIDPAQFPQLRAVIWRHALPGTVNDIAARGSRVWLLEDNRRRLIRIDTATRRISETSIDRPIRGQLTASAAAAWIAYPSHLP